MRQAAIVLLLSLTAVSHIRAAAVDSFQHYRDIKETNVESDEILSLILDSDIYAATQSGLADMRVVDSQGREVPYQLDKAVEKRTIDRRESSASHVVSLKELDGSLEIIAELDENAPTASGFTVRTPLKDFERRVQVLGSDAGQQWQPLVAEGLIFDYSRYMDISSRDVPLPENQYRQFRIVVDGVTDEQALPLVELTRHLQAGAELDRTERTTRRERPTRIDGVDFYHLTERQEPGKEKKTAYSIVEFHDELDAKNKRTIIHVRTNREPMTSLNVETSTPNFVRQAVVQVPFKRDGRSEWRDVGSSTISAVHFRGLTQEKLAISFPEQRQSEYRITIENEDNPPLTITKITAEGNAYQLKFIADGSAPYRLYYGSTTAETPHYDAAALMAAIDGRYASEAVTLGPVVANPSFRATAAQCRFFDNRLFFGAAIVLAVAVMSAVVYGAVRRVEQLPQD